MKYILSLFLCAFHGALLGQNLEIKVLFGSEKIGYSYILVNGKAVAITDSLGIAKLPIKKLNINDTISVQYLGYTATPFICSRDIVDKRELLFDITPIYNIDDVFITPNYVELLKKSLNPNLKLYNLLKINKFNFQILRSESGEEIAKASGNITMQLLNTMNYAIYDFKSNNDIDVKSYLANFKMLVKGSTMLIYNYSKRRINYKLTYNGISQDSRVFSLIDERVNSIARYQYFIDKNSKEIKRVELETSVERKDTIYLSSLIVNFYTKDGDLYIKDAMLESKNNQMIYRIKIWDVQVIPKNMLNKSSKEIFTIDNVNYSKFGS